MNIVEVIYLINQCKENQNIDRIWKKQQTKHHIQTIITRYLETRISKPYGTFKHFSECETLRIH